MSSLTTGDLHRLMPLAAELGIELQHASREEVVGTLEWREPLTTGGGVLHGGAVMALADSVGAACAYLNLPPGAATTTTSSSTVFLRGLGPGTATATARPLHVGRSTIAVEVDVSDAGGRRVARTTASQAVLSPRGG